MIIDKKYNDNSVIVDILDSPSSNSYLTGAKCPADICTLDTCPKADFAGCDPVDCGFVC